MGVNLGNAEGYIDLDFSSLKKGVASSIKELEKLDKEGDLVQSEFELLEATMKGVSGVFRDSAQKAQKLTAEIDTAKKKVDTYEKSVDGLNSVISKSKDEQTKLSQKIEDTSQKLEKAESKVKAAKTAYKEAEAELKKMADAHGEESEKAKKAAETVEASKKAYEDAARTAQNYRNELLQQQTRYEALNQEIDGSRRKITEYQTEINRAKTAISQMTEKLTLAESKLANMGITLDMSSQLLKKAGGKLDSIGNMLTIGVTTPLIGVGTAAIMAGNDFEAQMSRVKAISGATASEFEDLEQQAIDLGAATSFSATESAEAMENLASAGFSVSEITAAMPGMLALAASSGEDLASSADIASSTLRAFGLEAGEAGHVADVLAKNAADTNAAIMDTGYAMKYVAPVAHSAGWSLESVTAAIGKMADEGIRGETAGTTLRSALVRMMNPTDEMAEAMEALGITFYDAEGKMKPLSTIIDELQSSTADLTDEQRDSRIATLFGTEALSGMSILLKSSKEELDNLTEGLVNSDGASKKFAETMLDNTKGSIEEMNGSLETAGITIQKTLAPWITKVAGKVTDLANEFSDLEPEVQGNILKFGGLAIASGPVIKGLGKVTSGVGSLAKGAGTLLKDLGKLSSAKKAAKAIGEIGTFSTKAVSGVSGLSKALFNLASPTGVAIAATGALIAVGGAIKKAHDDMVEADIAEHFGDIELSAEEVEDVAKRLTHQDWMVTLDASIKAKEKLTEFQENLEETVAELNKTEWKVGVGLELTEEEKTSYKDSLTDYVDQAIGYVEQKQYTATLAIDTILKPGSVENQNIQDMSNAYYTGLNDKLQKLGEDLAEIVNKAYEDEMLSEDEMKLIEEKRNEIQKELDKLQEAEYQVKMENITADIPKGGLTPDSFSELMVEMNEQLAQRAEEIEQNKIEPLISLRAQLNDKIIQPDQYEKAKKDIELSAKEQLSNAYIEAVDFEIGTINTNYQEELEKVKDIYTTDTSNWVNDILGETGTAFYAALNQVEDGIRTAPPRIGASLSESAKETMRRALEEMQPQKEDLEATIQACQEAGYAVPENIRKGLMDIHRMEALLGETDGLFAELAKGIVESPEKFNAIKEAQTNGTQIPEALINALELYSGEVYDAASNTWKQVPAASAETIEATKTELSEHGVEASQALIDSLAIQAPNTRAKAIELLGQLKSAEEEQRPDILKQLFDLGIAVDSSLGDGISSNFGLVKSQTEGMIDVIDMATGTKITEVTPEFAERMRQMGNAGFIAMDQEMMNENLTAPSVDYINQQYANKWSDEGADTMGTEMMNETLTGPSIAYIDQQNANKWAQETQTSLQNALDGLKITANVGANIGINAIGGHAEGGIFSTPHIAAFAEDGPEAVIPLSPKYRFQGYEIWQRAGEELGLAESARKSMLKPPPSDSINYDLLAKKIADELRKAPLEVTSNIELHNEIHSEIGMDGEIVGRKIEPTISRIQAKGRK